MKIHTKPLALLMAAVFSCGGVHAQDAFANTGGSAPVVAVPAPMAKVLGSSPKTKCAQDQLDAERANDLTWGEQALSTATGVLAATLTAYTLKANCVSTGGQAVGALVAGFVGQQAGVAVARAARAPRPFAFPDGQCQPLFETELLMPDGSHVVFEAPRHFKPNSELKAKFNRDTQELSIEA